MKFIYTFLLIIAVVSCKTKSAFKSIVFTQVEVETLIEDPLLNVRALEVYKDKVYFATSRGEVKVIEAGSIKELWPVDTLNHPNFRAMAVTNEAVFTLSISSPALLYRNGKLVYREDHPKAFYDALEFWNDKEGIAIGDPIGGCMSVIITRDGGFTWKKLSCDALPVAKEGEAAFAASDTNISIQGNKTWVATGGKHSRVLFSGDRGKTWEAIDTPIVQGKETTGMYSIDFYDEKIGYAIGGDYTEPDANSGNKIVTKDGGKTWSLVADGQNPGYRSCVQYIPNRNGRELVAIGFKGIDYSHDEGLSWNHLSDEGFYTIRFLNTNQAIAAGNGRVVKLHFK
ncbi:WD40/YVTN/BNR-like repeat-containing protein [Mangrovimonas aestuarii]|uniref:WD40/YVTN/BNR-like repeat-containing protein n=1 Tax=Mangrovimonas aestuarii TaxID=3018443 RepID=UPI0023784938|nr:oxidoreductase [Mangrovimonas aestuarii]